MTFDGLIFDLDGTLWNCSRASADGYNLAYESFGLAKRVTKEFVESISGRTGSECDEILLAEVPVVMRRQVSQSLDQCEIAAVEEYAASALYPEVDSGLRILKENYQLCVVSNCGERYLEILHRQTSIGGLFTDSECFGRTKQPKHENIRAVVERQKMSSPCYIGDTAWDEEAASKAGVPFFHARYGFGRPVHDPIAFANFGELTRYFSDLKNYR